MSPPLKILFLFNGCDMIDSLELLCPRPWRTGAQTEVSTLCAFETVDFAVKPHTDGGNRLCFMF